MNKSDFIKELSKFKPNSTFLTLHSYHSKNDEIANHNIIFHISYESALQRSITALSDYIPTSELLKQAKEELIESFNKSINNIETTSIEDIDDGYTRFFDDGKYIKGVKFHNESNALHIYGLTNNKKIIVPGIYKEKNQRPLTIAKDILRKLCPVNKFRQYIVTPETVDYISIQNISLLPPS